MINHLWQEHAVTKNNLEEEPGTRDSHGRGQIKKAFGNSIPRITFNKEIFRLLLLRWIIFNNISFSQVNDSAFRTLLAYLCACVCNLLHYFYNTINLLTGHGRFLSLSSLMARYHPIQQLSVQDRKSVV